MMDGRWDFYIDAIAFLLITLLMTLLLARLTPLDLRQGGLSVVSIVIVAVVLAVPVFYLFRQI